MDNSGLNQPCACCTRLIQSWVVHVNRDEFSLNLQNQNQSPNHHTNLVDKPGPGLCKHTARALSPYCDPCFTKNYFEIFFFLLWDELWSDFWEDWLWTDPVLSSFSVLGLFCTSTAFDLVSPAFLLSLTSGKLTCILDPPDAFPMTIVFLSFPDPFIVSGLLLEALDVLNTTETLSCCLDFGFVSTAVAPLGVLEADPETTDIVDLGVEDLLMPWTDRVTGCGDTDNRGDSFGVEVLGFTSLGLSVFGDDTVMLRVDFWEVSGLNSGISDLGGVVWWWTVEIVSEVEAFFCCLLWEDLGVGSELGLSFFSFLSSIWYIDWISSIT